MNEEESKELAQLVSFHLRGLTGESLAGYLQNVYLLDSVAGLSTDVIYAVEVTEGNFATGDISSVPVRCWKISGEDCRLIPFVNMRPFNTASDAGNLWPHPIVSYYADLPLVLSKEGIGEAISKEGTQQILKFFRIVSVIKDRGSFRVLAEQKSWLFKV